MITTHVLDTGRGKPASHIPVELHRFVTGEGWRSVGYGVTSPDGRIEDFGESHVAALYRLTFDVAAQTPGAFFPSISITFEVRDPFERYHIPLLLGPFSYSTYRGS